MIIKRYDKFVLGSILSIFFLISCENTYEKGEVYKTDSISHKKESQLQEVLFCNIATLENLGIDGASSCTSDEASRATGIAVFNKIAEAYISNTRKPNRYEKKSTGYKRILKTWGLKDGFHVDFKISVANKKVSYPYYQEGWVLQDDLWEGEPYYQYELYIKEYRELKIDTRKNSSTTRTRENAFASPPKGSTTKSKVSFSEWYIHNKDVEVSETIMAHEIGHVLAHQKKIITNTEHTTSLGHTVRNKELLADFIAGVYLGYQNYEQNYLDRCAAVAESIGDSCIGSRSHHGTAKQRKKAVILGQTLGYGFFKASLSPSTKTNQILNAFHKYLKKLEKGQANITKSLQNKNIAMSELVKLPNNEFEEKLITTLLRLTSQ